MHKYFFPGKRWEAFTNNLCNKLKSETALITGLPQIGLTTYLKHIEETYKSITKDEKTIIISIEILPSQTKIFHISAKILKSLNYKLSFPKYLHDLNCESSLYEILKRGRKILIIINRFQELRKSSESMMFLQSLRSINSLKIRFLLSCDISCLTDPNSYKSAGILASANILTLPTHTPKEVEQSIRNYRQLYNWIVPIRLAHEIYILSGGVCGLVKYISKFIHENKPRTIEIKKLLDDPAIRYKLEQIIEKLEKNGLVKNSLLDLTKKDILKRVGILDQENKLRIQLLRPLLQSRKKKTKTPNLDKLLSLQEKRLFQLFDSRPEEILSLDEISTRIWGEQALSKYSLWAIYKIISSLKKKIKPLGFDIKNYRGRGYQLVKARK